MTVRALPPDRTAELLLPGGVRLRLTGRALLLVVLVAVNQAKLNALPVGRLVASFSGRKVWAELAESLPPVKLEAEAVSATADEVAAPEEVLDLAPDGSRE